MSNVKKKYKNGQSRGGGSPNAVATGFGVPGNNNGSPKDYHRQCVSFHGSEMALEAFNEKLKKA